MLEQNNPAPRPALEGYYFRLAGIGEDAVASRASYPNAVESEFDEGDRVGIFTIDAVGAAAQSNLLYTVVGAAGNPQALEDTGTQALEGEGYKYLIYYPYSETMTLAGLASLTHSVSASQNNTDEDGNGLTEFEKSDFLWDMASVAVDENGTPKTDKDGKKYVDVVMDHVTATIVIHIMSEFESSTEPELLNMQRTVKSGIDLTKAPTVDALRDAVFTEDRTASKLAYNDAERGNIKMQNIKYSASDKVPDDRRSFRAAVPPQIIENDQAIVSVGGMRFKYTHPDGKPLALLPGKRYTFHVNDPTKPFIDIDEDDSWIFDVIDPVTGQKVGLLCREYIRFQPHSAGSWKDNMSVKDKLTGTPCEVTVNNKTYNTKMISSQVWVFYDLWKFAEDKDHTLEQALMAGSRNQDGLKTDDDPYLDSGIALRFIYDVQNRIQMYMDTNAEQLAAGYPADEVQAHGWEHNWPSPHTYNGNGGMYLADHGQMWVNEGGSSGYGRSSGIQHEFWMHGGKIYWGYTERTDAEHEIRYNSVHLFEMPKEQITTQQAIKYGHINVIRGSNGEPIGAEVSYDPYLPGDRNVGVLVPKYINDFRSSDEGTITYPLVKVGYNNIWSKKGLRTRYYNSKKQNEKLECYQGKDLNFNFPHEFYFEIDNVKYLYDANAEIIYKINSAGLKENHWWHNDWKDRGILADLLKKFDIPGSYAYPYGKKDDGPVYLDVYDYLAQYGAEDVPLSQNPARREKEITFTKLYNFTIMANGTLRDAIVPDESAYDNRMSCYIPRTVRFYELMNYVGYLANVKTMTSHVMTKTKWDAEDESLYHDALLDQKLITDGIYGQMILRIYTPNVVGLDLRAVGMLVPQNWGEKNMGSGGPRGAGGFGALPAFWINADPSYTPLQDEPYMNRDDAVAVYVNKIYAGYSSNPNSIKSDFLLIGPDLVNGFWVTEDGMSNMARWRSRMYCAVRPVLKFNHQNGPNKHEREEATPQAVVSGVKNLVKTLGRKSPTIEAPSQVKESGIDVSVVLTPVLSTD